MYPAPRLRTVDSARQLVRSKGIDRRAARRFITVGGCVRSVTASRSFFPILANFRRRRPTTYLSPSPPIRANWIVALSRHRISSYIINIISSCSLYSYPRRDVDVYIYVYILLCADIKCGFVGIISNVRYIMMLLTRTKCYCIRRRVYLL